MTLTKLIDYIARFSIAPPKRFTPSWWFVALGLTRTIEVRPSNEPDTTERQPQEIADNREDAAKDGQDSGDGGLQHHSLELCREGEKNAPPPASGKRGSESIGTLSCSTLLYTEKSWRTEASE